MSALKSCPACYGLFPESYDCDACNGLGHTFAAKDVSYAQVEAAFFSRGIRRAERRRAEGFVRYREQDGCYPDTFAEVGDRLRWATARLLVRLGVGRFRKWIARNVIASDPNPHEATGLDLLELSGSSR